jgi:hypothetical protein
MIRRCYDPRMHAFERYGGCGITVFQPWRDSFEAFARYMGPRPTVHHSIDRWPDKCGNYEPGNVRWASESEQSRNLRTREQIVKAQLECTHSQVSDSTQPPI